MYNINVTNARAKLYELLKMAICDSEILNIATKNGNAVIISEAEYQSLLETLYLSSDPSYKQSLLEGKNTDLSDCVDESDVTL